MNPLHFPLLADENIHPDVTIYLKEAGYDLLSVKDYELSGHTDREILQTAHKEGRVVLTHDSDFGWLAIAQDEPYTGIVYLRPGHIHAEFTLKTLQVIEAQIIDVSPPFILVAERIGNRVNIRIRQQ